MVGASGVEQNGADIGELLGKARVATVAQTGEVLPHEHLPVAVRARADADRRDPKRLRHGFGRRGGHHLHEDAERARPLEGLGLLDESCGSVPPS